MIKTYQRVIVEGDLLLELLVGDCCRWVPVAATGHLETLRVLILLDVAMAHWGSGFFSLEEGVPVGEEGPVVTSSLRAVIKHFYLNK